MIYLLTTDNATKQIPALHLAFNHCKEPNFSWSDVWMRTCTLPTKISGTSPYIIPTICSHARDSKCSNCPPTPLAAVKMDLYLLSVAIMEYMQVRVPHKHILACCTNKIYRKMGLNMTHMIMVPVEKGLMITGITFAFCVEEPKTF